MFACLVSLALPPVEAGCLTLLTITLLLLRDAYQPVKCPTTGVAILQAQAASLLTTFYIYWRTGGHHIPNPQFSVLFIAAVLPFSMPVMGMLRAESDPAPRTPGCLPDTDMALEDMTRDYQDFELRMRRGNRLESPPCSCPWQRARVS